MNPDYLLLGHFTRDVLPDRTTIPGGTSLYAALTAHRLGRHVGVVSALAQPGGHAWLFSSSEAIDHLVALAPQARWAGATALAMAGDSSTGPVSPTGASAAAGSGEGAGATVDGTYLVNYQYSQDTPKARVRTYLGGPAQDLYADLSATVGTSGSTAERWRPEVARASLAILTRQRAGRLS